MQEEQPLQTDGSYVATVRLMSRQNQFKVELKAPAPSRMELAGDRLIFSGDPAGQDNSFLAGAARYEINKEAITAIEFNALLNSAIKLSFDADGPKTVYVQYLGEGPLGMYNIHETRRIYGNLLRFWRGDAVDSKRFPRWVPVAALLLVAIGGAAGGLIGTVIGLGLGFLLYKLAAR